MFTYPGQEISLVNVKERAPLACQECRRKKIKCNSDTPACSNCVKKGYSCVYTPRSKTRSRAKLRDLNELKKENQLLKAELNVKDKVQLPVTTRDIGQYPQPPQLVSEVRDNGMRSFEFQDVSITNRKAYHMIRYGRQNLAQDMAFQQVFGQISLKEFHALLENYWRFENVNIMIIWKRIFLSDLLSSEGGKYSSKCLILSLLAAGSTFAYDKSLRDKGTACFLLAKKFLKKELWDLKITTPQSICLLCIFEHTRGNRSEELYYSKLAVNVALELGLNKDNITSTDPFAKDEETVRRFAWWSCYQMDMLVRVALRQAPTIRKEVTGVNPPQVSPFRYIMGLPEEKKDSYFEFFFISTITLELFVIAGETEEICYAKWPTVSNEKRQGMIDTCISELSIFWETAQMNFGKDPEEYNSPQVLTFKLRYCYTNITITGYFIEPQMLPPTPAEMKSIETCIKYAKRLLSHLEKYASLHGIWTLESFATDFIGTGLIMMLCAMNYGDPRHKDKYLEHANKFIKLMLSFPNEDKYLENLKQVKIQLTEWNIDLSLAELTGEVNSISPSEILLQDKENIGL